MKGRCQRYQRGALNCMRTFLFLGPKFFTSISRTGEMEVSAVQTRCSKRCSSISYFGAKNIFTISKFLVVARCLRRCQRLQHIALSSMRAFSLFGSKIFSSISLTG